MSSASSSDNSAEENSASESSDDEAAPAEPAPGKRAAEKSAGQDLQGKKKLRRKDGSGGKEGEKFVLNLDALQGRWRHSTLPGLLTVRKDVVEFESGIGPFRVRTRPDGLLEMIGWIASAEKSDSDRIVWSCEGQGTCSWFLESDADDKVADDGLEALDARNIISGKRERKKVNYRELDRKMKEEERRMQASDSDEDAGALGEAKEVMSAGEWSQLHTQNVAKVVERFRTWMLATRTPQHEERLRRRGNLTTTLDVKITGAGQRQLQEQLRPYGAHVAHRDQGTVIRVDAAARDKFKARHPDLWRNAPLPQASEPQPKVANEGLDAASSASRAPPQSTAQVATSAGDGERAGGRLKKKKARIADDDDEVPAPAAVAPADGAGATDDRPESLASKDPPQATSPVQPVAVKPAAPAQAADAASAVSVKSPSAASSSPVAAAPQPPKPPAPSVPPAPQVSEAAAAAAAQTVEQAQELLDKWPPPRAKETAVLLSFLNTCNIDFATLARTKVGITINKIRKHYTNDRAINSAATDLLTKWKRIFQEAKKAEESKQEGDAKEAA
eukprot:gnl/TRDRNA2_/TRDRNA2_157590_c0_seq2.p1 gnl/TRDRNA2_/TRDRNA2_157590_c0~~gnl/TRDRNA2_/TRDRNA2_157590_c0_seq2.p1  ORF type:complete len:559 (-),score=137.69 gnl/TRDRNA2_/TRDRNA2_157590_c0_seq2:41-1717(-)